MKPNIELHKICVWAFCLCFRGERLRNAAPSRSQRGGQGARKHKVEPKFRRFLFFFSPLAAKNKHAGNREKKIKKCDDVSSLSAADGAKRGVFFGALSHVSGETWRHPLVVPWLTLTGKRRLAAARHAGALGRPESVSRPPSFTRRAQKSGKREKTARGFTPSEVWQERT